MQINIKNLKSTNLSLDVTIQPGPAPTGRVIRALLVPGAQFDASPVASLEEVGKNSQIRSLIASGTISVTVVEQATDTANVEAQFNKLRNDVVAAWAQILTTYHKAVPASLAVDTAALPAIPTDLPTILTFSNAAKALVNLHLVSTGDVGAHRAAAAATIGAASATDQTTANTLLNEIKADYNTHLSEAGVHIKNDTTNTIAAADATNLATSITLATEIRADYLLHQAAAMDSLPMGTT